MAKIRIESLRIRMPATTRAEGERVGREVAAELATLAPSLTARQVGGLTVKLDETAIRSPAAIARAIREKLG